MTPEDAYSILEAIAEINGFTNRLKKWIATADEQAEEELAQNISEAHQERLAPFSFSACKIPVGAEIEFCNNATDISGIICIVADEKHVEYQGEIWSLTGLAKELMQTKQVLAGPRYFKYNGEWLNDIQKRISK